MDSAPSSQRSVGDTPLAPGRRYDAPLSSSGSTSSAFAFRSPFQRTPSANAAPTGPPTSSLLNTTTPATARPRPSSAGNTRLRQKPSTPTGTDLFSALAADRNTGPPTAPAARTSTGTSLFKSTTSAASSLFASSSAQRSTGSLGSSNTQLAASAANATQLFSMEDTDADDGWGGLDSPSSILSPVGTTAKTTKATTDDDFSWVEDDLEPTPPKQAAPALAKPPSTPSSMFPPTTATPSTPSSMFPPTNATPSTPSTSLFASTRSQSSTPARPTTSLFSSYTPGASTFGGSRPTTPAPAPTPAAPVTTADFAYSAEAEATVADDDQGWGDEWGANDDKPQPAKPAPVPTSQPPPTSASFAFSKPASPFVSTPTTAIPPATKAPELAAVISPTTAKEGEFWGDESEDGLFSDEDAAPEPPAVPAPAPVVSPPVQEPPKASVVEATTSVDANEFSYKTEATPTQQSAPADDFASDWNDDAWPDDDQLASSTFGESSSSAANNAFATSAPHVSAVGSAFTSTQASAADASFAGYGENSAQTAESAPFAAEANGSYFASTTSYEAATTSTQESYEYQSHTSFETPGHNEYSAQYSSGEYGYTDNSANTESYAYSTNREKQANEAKNEWEDQSQTQATTEPTPFASSSKPSSVVSFGSSSFTAAELTYGHHQGPSSDAEVGSTVSFAEVSSAGATFGGSDNASDAAYLDDNASETRSNFGSSSAGTAFVTEAASSSDGQGSYDDSTITYEPSEQYGTNSSLPDEHQDSRDAYEEYTHGASAAEGAFGSSSQAQDSTGLFGASTSSASDAFASSSYATTTSVTTATTSSAFETTQESTPFGSTSSAPNDAFAAPPTQEPEASNESPFGATVEDSANPFASSSANDGFAAAPGFETAGEDAPNPFGAPEGTVDDHELPTSEAGDLFVNSPVAAAFGGFNQPSDANGYFGHQSDTASYESTGYGYEQQYGYDNNGYDQQQAQYGGYEQHEQYAGQDYYANDQSASGGFGQEAASGDANAVFGGSTTQAPADAHTFFSPSHASQGDSAARWDEVVAESNHMQSYEQNEVFQYDQSKEETIEPASENVDNAQTPVTEEPATWYQESNNATPFAEEPNGGAWPPQDDSSHVGASNEFGYSSEYHQEDNLAEAGAVPAETIAPPQTTHAAEELSQGTPFGGDTQEEVDSSAMFGGSSSAFDGFGAPQSQANDPFAASQQTHDSYGYASAAGYDATQSYDASQYAQLGYAQDPANAQYPEYEEKAGVPPAQTGYQSDAYFGNSAPAAGPFAHGQHAPSTAAPVATGPPAPPAVPSSYPHNAYQASPSYGATPAPTAVPPVVDAAATPAHGHSYEETPYSTHGASTGDDGYPMPYTPKSAAMHAARHTPVMTSNKYKDPTAVAPSCLVSFGFGGNVATMFPKRKLRLNAASYTTRNSPRNPMANQFENTPHGELRKGPVQVYRMEQLHPKNTEFEQLDKFPGPLTENLTEEAILQYVEEKIKSIRSSSPFEEDERLLLGILRVLIKCNGHLRSDPKDNPSDPNSPEVQLVSLLKESDQRRRRHKPSAFPPPKPVQYPSHPDATVRNANRIRELLLLGDRIQAVDVAIQSQMWPEAMLIASFTGKDEYKRVLCAYFSSHYSAGDPCRALYMSFADQEEKSVHEPQKLMQAADEQPSSAILSSWVIHVQMLLANRTADTNKILVELGDRLWKEANAVVAAHICYLLAGVGVEAPSPNSKIALLGGDHRTPEEARFYVSPTTVQRTEIYEWIQKRAHPNAMTMIPFQGYKLIYAMLLADHGKLETAFKYVNAMLSVIRSVTANMKPGTSMYLEGMQGQLTVLDDRLRQHLGQDRAESVAAAAANTKTGKWGLGNALNLMGKIVNRVVEGSDAPPQASGAQQTSTSLFQGAPRADGTNATPEYPSAVAYPSQLAPGDVNSSIAPQGPPSNSGNRLYAPQKAPNSGRGSTYGAQPTPVGGQGGYGAPTPPIAAHGITYDAPAPPVVPHANTYDAPPAPPIAGHTSGYDAPAPPAAGYAGGYETPAPPGSGSGGSYSTPQPPGSGSGASYGAPSATPDNSYGTQGPPSTGSQGPTFRAYQAPAPGSGRGNKQAAHPAFSHSFKAPGTTQAHANTGRFSAPPQGAADFAEPPAHGGDNTLTSAVIPPTSQPPAAQPPAQFQKPALDLSGDAGKQGVSQELSAHASPKSSKRSPTRPLGEGPGSDKGNKSPKIKDAKKAGRSKTPPPSKSSSSGWFSGISRMIAAKMNPDAKVAKLGEQMEAYFDEEKKRWVFPGETQSEEPTMPSAPPIGPLPGSTPSGAPPGTQSAPGSISGGSAADDPLSALMAPPPVRSHATLMKSDPMAAMMAPPTRSMYGQPRGAAPAQKRPPKRPQFAVFKPVAAPAQEAAPADEPPASE